MAKHARLWITRLRDAVLGEPAGPASDGHAAPAVEPDDPVERHLYVPAKRSPNAVEPAAGAPTAGRPPADTNLEETVRMPVGRELSAEPSRARAGLPRVFTSASAGVAADTGRLGDFWIMAASMAGNQHQAYGFGREDAYAVAYAERQGCVVVAVADGVGSTRQAETIAQVAAGRAVRLARQEIESSSIGPAKFYDDVWDKVSRPIVADVAANLPEALEEVGGLRPYEAIRPDFGGKDLRSPATTLAVAAIWRERGSFLVRWIAVGDSAIFGVERNSARMNRRHPEGEATGENRTHSLPRDVTHARTGTMEIGDTPGLVLTTDGGEAMIEGVGTRAFLDAVHQAGRQAVGPATFAAILDVEIEGEHDDRTCVVVYEGR